MPSDDRKPPLLVPFPGSGKRAGTIHGDRNEDHKVRISPTPIEGIALTPAGLPRAIVVRQKPKTVSPVTQKPVVMPTHEVDFEGPTPPVMDPTTWHAMQTMRAETLMQSQLILEMVGDEIDKRAEREEKAAAARRKFYIALVGAVCTGGAIIIGALVHGCG